MKRYFNGRRPRAGGDSSLMWYGSGFEHGSPLARRRHHALGFTLIEILVVILIVGITVSFALVSFGDFGEKRRVIVAAEQFNYYVKLVQQQAMLETSTLGIDINKNGYQILRFQAPDSWAPISARSIFHAQHFPHGLVINVPNTPHKKAIPALVIDSSGGMTPFSLNFGSAKQTSIITIVGEQNGAVHMVKSP